MGNVMSSKTGSEQEEIQLQDATKRQFESINDQLKRYDPDVPVPDCLTDIVSVIMNLIPEGIAAETMPRSRNAVQLGRDLTEITYESMLEIQASCLSDEASDELRRGLLVAVNRVVIEEAFEWANQSTSEEDQKVRQWVAHVALLRGNVMASHFYPTNKTFGKPYPFLGTYFNNEKVLASMIKKRVDVYLDSYKGSVSKSDFQIGETFVLINELYVRLASVAISVEEKEKQMVYNLKNTLDYWARHYTDELSSAGVAE